MCVPLIILPVSLFNITFKSIVFGEITGHHVVSYVVEYNGVQIFWYFAIVEKIIKLHNTFTIINKIVQTHSHTQSPTHLHAHALTLSHTKHTI